jgi:Mrp family chromosome partitioning ATPase
VVVVLVVASGAAWEPAALRLLSDAAGVVVLKRCVDVDDLLAAASVGQADVAVLGLDSPGLDPAATDHLRRHQVRPVAVLPTGADPDAARLRAARVGVTVLVAEEALADLPGAVLAADEEAVSGEPAPDPGQSAGESTGESTGPAGGDGPGGRVIVVWGPAGAPGRTTVAAGVAAELARRGLRTALVDADP